MVKAGFVILFGVLGAALAYPLANDLVSDGQEDTDYIDRDVDFAGRQDPIGPVVGAIGTALVPVINAILGPILTNIANGISNAFNTNNNKVTTAATTTTTTTAKPSRAQSNFAGDGLLSGQPAFVVRVPGSDTPLYLYQHPQRDASGLPAIGPDTPVIPLNFAKLDAQAIESDDESVAVESADTGAGETKPTQATNTKRYNSPRPKTDTEYA